MAGAFCTSFRQSCQSTVTAPVSLLNPSFTDGVFGGNTSTVNGSLVSPTLPNTSCAMIVQLWPIMKGDGAFNTAESERTETARSPKESTYRSMLHEVFAFFHTATTPSSSSLTDWNTGAAGACTAMDAVAGVSLFSPMLSTATTAKESSPVMFHAGSVTSGAADLPEMEPVIS